MTGQCIDGADRTPLQNNATSAAGARGGGADGHFTLAGTAAGPNRQRRVFTTAAQTAPMVTRTVSDVSDGLIEPSPIRHASDAGNERLQLLLRVHLEVVLRCDDGELDVGGVQLLLHHLLQDRQRRLQRFLQRDRLPAAREAAQALGGNVRRKEAATFGVLFWAGRWDWRLVQQTMTWVEHHQVISTQEALEVVKVLPAEVMLRCCVRENNRHTMTPVPHPTN